MSTSRLQTSLPGSVMYHGVHLSQGTTMSAMMVACLHPGYKPLYQGLDMLPS